MKRAMSHLIGVVCLTCAAAAMAQPQYVYPARGQGHARQARDETACTRWATRKTGYDPARPQVVVAATPAPVTGSGARLRGAAVGGGIGAVAGGNVGASAFGGAVVGGLARRAANRRAADAQNQAAAQQVQAARAAFANARAACLTGKGYSVR